MSGFGANRSALLGAGALGLVCGAVLAVVLPGDPAQRAEGAGERPVAERRETTPPTREGAGAEDAGGGRTALAAAEADSVGPAADGAADAAEPAQPGTPALEGAPLGELVAALGATHAALHTEGADPASLGAALDAALEARFPKDKDRRKLLRRLYTDAGAGHFARGGRVTGLGGALLERVRDLELHAMDPAPYGREALEEAVASLPVDAAAAEAGGSAAVRTLETLLEAPTLDAAQATSRLAALSPPASRADLDAAAAALRGRGLGAAVHPEDLPRDVHLAATFLQLALDLRFLKKAGPFSLRDAKELFSKPKDVDAVLALLEAALEAPDAEGALRALDPPHPHYAPMLAIYARYREYAASGQCQSLPGGWRLREGMKGKEVKRLQERLMCEGYHAGPADGVFDASWVEAVKTFQSHHELPAEGNVLADTLKSLNVPIERRVEQIAIALQRMRESSVAQMGDPFIRVNIPAFELTFYAGHEIVRRQRVIVGTNRLDDDKQQLIQGHINRTQILTTRLYEVIVNPTWILPQRVEHGELKGKLGEDPDYLDKHNIKQVTLGDGKKVYVQGLGDGNVLGKVKFLLEKTNAIYLHDTDKRHLFREQRRDFSHGCVRVDGAIDFAKWLLARDGVTEEEVERAFRSSSLQRAFDLKAPIDLMMEYITIDLSEQGLPVFLTDVYGYDKAYLEGNLPPRVSTRWGSSKLRPRWVPEVDKEIVDKWRAEGKPAPRDYDPKKQTE